MDSGTIKLSLDGGKSYTDYDLKKTIENGIDLNNEQDLSQIKIKGTTNILQNAEVVSSVKIDDSKYIIFTEDVSVGGFWFPDCIVGIEIQNGICFKDFTNLNYFPFLQKLTLTANGFYDFKAGDLKDCTSLKTIVLKEDITELPDTAFTSHPSLENIYLPRSLKKIGYAALAYCSNLKNIYYAGTPDEWNELTSTSGGMMQNSPATVHYNYKY